MQVVRRSDAPRDVGESNRTFRPVHRDRFMYRMAELAVYSFIPGRLDIISLPLRELRHPVMSVIVRPH